MDSKRKVIYKIMPFFLITAIIVLAGLFFLYGGKKYTVTVSPGILTDRDRYREGEEVTVKAHNVPDEITDIYVDGTKAVPSTESDDEWVVVKFIMPAHDVNVSTISVNISADPSEKEETVLVTYMSMTTGTEMPTGTLKRSMPEAMPANSESVTAKLETIAASIATAEMRMPNCSRMSASIWSPWLRPTTCTRKSSSTRCAPAKT